MLGALQQQLGIPAHVIVTWEPEELGLDLAAAEAWAEAQRRAEQERAAKADHAAFLERRAAASRGM